MHPGYIIYPSHGFTNNAHGSTNNAHGFSNNAHGVSIVRAHGSTKNSHGLINTNFVQGSIHIAHDSTTS